MRTLAVTKAEHIGDYRLKITFSGATSQVVDFGPFLLNHPHPQHDKYRKLANFKRFKIERGNVVWGRDWDLIFPISQLHQGVLLQRFVDSFSEELIIRIRYGSKQNGQLNLLD